MDAFDVYMAIVKKDALVLFTLTFYTLVFAKDSGTKFIPTGLASGPRLIQEQTNRIICI